VSELGGGLPSIDTLGDLTGKRVLLRSDLNVPLDGDRITDDGRIRASIPTLRRLLDAGASVVVVSHLGRPKGQPDPRYSLQPVADRLAELLDRKVGFGASADEGDADVVLLENLRFDPAETSKQPDERAELAARLAEQADVYVDDAFGVMHRSHASVDELAGLLPSAAGDLVLREVEVLRRLTESPDRPYVVVLGGSKVSDKLAVIEALLRTVDRLLVGGGMCFTFLAAQGLDVGNSLLEADRIEDCRRFLETGKVTLPVDVVIAEQVSTEAETKVVDVDAIPDGWMGLDIGPRSVELFAERLADARTVFWNGPMGVFELAAFAAGTHGVASAVAGLADALTVVGGGDSAAAVRSLGIDEAGFSHISTGGGASLEFLEGRTLPGMTALEHERG
jgi:phosphoglycerate kinase